MAGRAREREAAALRGGDRSSGSEQGGLEARLGGEGVPVEPGRLPDRPDSLDVVIGVAAEDRLHRRRLDLVALERRQQHRQPFLGFRMARRRMQAREGWVTQDVDRRTASASSSSDAPSWARPIK